MVFIGKNAELIEIPETKELKLDMVFNKPKQLFTCEHCGHIGDICEVTVWCGDGTSATRLCCENCGCFDSPNDNTFMDKVAIVMKSKVSVTIPERRNIRERCELFGENGAFDSVTVLRLLNELDESDKRYDEVAHMHTNTECHLYEARDTIKAYEKALFGRCNFCKHGYNGAAGNNDTCKRCYENRDIAYENNRQISGIDYYATYTEWEFDDDSFKEVE